jgi:hypothetical protein
MITVPSYRLCILQLNIEYYISPIMNKCEIFLCIVKISVFDYSIQIDTYQSIAGNLPFIVIEPLSVHMLYKQ